MMTLTPVSMEKEQISRVAQEMFEEAEFWRVAE